jgi:arylsulfatase A-like enzyme
MKPNIVFICADQLGAKWLGCYGGGVDSTPTLDRLAREGVRFDRCYANFPLCAPSRATMLSGRSASVHGVITNNLVYPAGLPTYAHVLKREGYRTGGFGKFHQEPMTLPAPEDLQWLGFDESLVTEDPKWPWYEWVRRDHPEFAEKALSMCWWFWPDTPHHPEWEKARDLREELRAARTREYGWNRIGASPLPSEIHDTTYITNLGLDFMRRHTREYPNRPFICHISYVDPHDPCDPPADYADLFSPADMPPPLPAEWVEEGLTSLRKAQEENNFDGFYQNGELIARFRALYNAQLKYMDDQMARVVDWLKDSGQWEDTILLFTTDHGEMLGDHGQITKFSKHYDAGIRCPLIIAGGPVACGEADELVSTLDLFPTFCDWAGVEDEDRPPLEGLSMAPRCRGEQQPPETRDWLFVGGMGVASVLTADRWRLTHYASANEGQMFDLGADPDELENLYRRPDHIDRKVELLERLNAASCVNRQLPRYDNLAVYEGRRFTPEWNEGRAWLHDYGS